MVNTGLTFWTRYILPGLQCFAVIGKTACVVEPETYFLVWREAVLQINISNYNKIESDITVVFGDPNEIPCSS